MGRKYRQITVQRIEVVQKTAQDDQRALRRVFELILKASRQDLSSHDSHPGR